MILGLFLIFLLKACASDNNSELDSTEPNTVNSYFLLENSGMHKVSVVGTDEECHFTFQVKKSGSKSETAFVVHFEEWTKEQLSDYNEKEKSSYVLLPPSLYSYPQNVVFDPNTNQVDVEIKFNRSKVLSEWKRTSANYIIALKLKSDDLKVKNSASELLISLFVDCPTIGITTPSQNVNVTQDIIPVSIQAKLDYNPDGVSTVNPYNFVCNFAVPFNAEELVTEYNKAYNTSYQLLPANNYDLGEGIYFKAGANQGEGKILVKREGMAVANYLLPLKLGNCSNDNIICKDEVCFLQVGRTYTNPIISDRSVPDPSVIRGEDGYFYLYATQTKTYWMPVYRSKDLVNWEYQGTAFTNATKPNLLGGGAFWAPEIRYFNGKYILYYSWAKMNGADVSYTAVAVGDTPMGPFPNSKELLSNELFGSNCIDQFYYEESGKKYMFYGSFKGIYVTELNDDALSVKMGTDGKPTLKKQVCGNAFEGTNIYKKGKYYYLFASIGSCCNGVNASYQVVVGRSDNLFGPYVDREGKSMLDNNWELVLEGDGQKWIGPGHNSIIVQDDEGTDWMIYHSYLKLNGEVGGRLGMLDRLLWTDDGWPYVKNCVPSNSELIPVFYN